MIEQKKIKFFCEKVCRLKKWLYLCNGNKNEMITKMNARQILEDAGVRPSVQRLAVMDYLATHKTHPTVDEIYSALAPSIPTLSKTTVYNTLKLFVENGVTQMLTIDEQNSRYDADVSPHAHFLCSKCGKVYDLQFVDFANTLPEEIDGHTIKEVYQFFKGICSCCAEK